MFIMCCMYTLCTYIRHVSYVFVDFLLHAFSVSEEIKSLSLSLSLSLSYAAVAGEMGWTPVILRQWSAVSRHYSRLYNMADTRLNNTIFIWTKN